MRRTMLIATAIAGLTAAAGADIYEFTFTGEIDSVAGSAPAPIVVGDGFVFRYRFDSNAADSDGAPNFGLYVGAMEQPSLAIGGWAGGGLGTGDIGVLDNGFAGDGYSATVQSPLIFASVSMTNLGGGAFDSDALPLDLDLADWDIPNFAVEVLVGPAYWNASGTVTGFSSRIVPGPEVLGAGLLALAGAGRRRRGR